MASSSSATPATDADVWYAIAGASVRLPPPSSSVYYFPQGHLEHYGLPAARNPDTALGRPYVLCHVLSIGLFYHPLTEQPFAKILLKPETGISLPQSRSEDTREDQNPGDQNGVVSYAKVLTPSDANNGGGFSVPRSCADLVFPRLDFNADPPAQNLSVRDTGGNAWDFRHIYRGTPRRHLLTTGWSKFVNAKKLVAGDSVVFMRRLSAAYGHPEMFVGIRRAGNSGVCCSSWKSEETSASYMLAEMEKAAHKLEFEVIYWPKVGSPDFMVEAAKVENALKVGWLAGIRVKVNGETGDLTPVALSFGTITSAALPESGPWRGSPWRMLQVAWDEPASNADKVSPWEVEFIPLAPHPQPELHPAKKLKARPDADSIEPFDSYHNNTLAKLLKDCIETEAKTDPKALHRHSRNSSPGSNVDSQGGLSSFRLFGKTIQMAEPVEWGSESDVISSEDSGGQTEVTLEQTSVGL